MQLLLARHPAVVTSQETHLFSAYLGDMLRAWETDLAAPEDRRRVGLTTVLEPAAFRAACRGFADTVFAEVAAANPQAETIVEKTPGHVLRAREILRVYPAASFVHVIRDPRDVVCSLRSAGRSWGSHWAPTNVALGARYWQRRVEAGREIGRLTPRYHEVRYEGLLQDAAAVLAGVCEFAGLAADPQFCREAAETCRLDRLQRVAAEPADVPWRLSGEPEGFFRRGRARGWSDDLTRGELRRVEHGASPLMAELGYVPTTRSPHRRPLRTAIRERLGWRLERAAAACHGWVMRL